jgi:D-alanyl-D-alanine carboxypeptidase
LRIVKTRQETAIALLVIGLLMMTAGLACPALIVAESARAAGLTDQSDPSLSAGNEPAKQDVLYPTVNHSSISALAIETSRQRTLYSRQISPRIHMPAASKIMTALIACERLKPDVQVTISKVAAEAAALEKTPDGVLLHSGDKYPLGYLLARLIYYDSDAAALAIAEQVANVEEQFVEIMNARAAAFRMTGTVFKNSTGEPVYDMSATGFSELDPSLALLQYTTLPDMALLFLQAVANPVFLEYLTTSSRYFVLSESSLVIMRNKMSGIWTRSEGLINGVFYSQWANSSFMAATGTVNGINMIVLTYMGDPDEADNDLMAIFQACESFYTRSPLVIAGDSFTGATEQTIDGESFGLVFKNTVYYVHPHSNDWLKQTIRYKSLGPFNRPILRSMTVGQVIFDLMDGTQIAVDVAPDRQILSSISIIDNILSALQRNSNLATVLIIAGLILIIVMLIRIVIGIDRIRQLIKRIRLEKRDRSSEK